MERGTGIGLCIRPAVDGVDADAAWTSLEEILTKHDSRVE